MTASPRDPQVRDPVETYTTTRTWTPQLEAQKYYHTHPDAYDEASVKAAMDSRFPQGLPIQDLCPIQPDEPEDVSEPEEFRNLSRDRVTTLRARIQHAHLALSIESSPDGQADRRTGEAQHRAIAHGDERYENLMISDFKESYTGPIIVDNSIRRDIAWILAETALSRKGKLSQIALANKWSGHGTSMVDLKEAAGLSRKTPCTIPLFNKLCDCLRNAVYDIGRGRGNPRNICLGHNCWGITINIPLQEINQEVVRKWMNRYGCDLSNKCPLGFYGPSDAQKVA